jgi:hypothetical protein
MNAGGEIPMEMSLLILHWLYPFVRGVFFGLLAMTIHESGHLLAALVLGVRIKTVALRWKGLCTVRESGPPHEESPRINCVTSYELGFSSDLALVTDLWYREFVPCFF